LRRQLAAASILSTIFSGVKPDPTDETSTTDLRCAQTNCDLVIGLGGGSPMDAAKSSPSPHERRTASRVAGYHRIARAGLPLMCIPTTAGTGSEVTKVAVITDTERDVKMMMLDVTCWRACAGGLELSLTMRPAHRARRVDTLTHGSKPLCPRRRIR